MASVKWVVVAALLTIAVTISSCSNTPNQVQTSPAGAPISQAQANASGGMNPKMAKKVGGDAGGAKTLPTAKVTAITAPADQTQ